MTRGRVGAPDERDPFRFHDAVVGFVDRCLSRNLAASSQRFEIWLIFLRPILAQHLAQIFFFFIFCFKLRTFCCKDLCSKRTVYKYYGGYQDSNFFWQHRLSIFIGHYWKQSLCEKQWRKLFYVYVRINTSYDITPT